MTDERQNLINEICQYLMPIVSDVVDAKNAVFGEFSVIDADSLSVIDRVIGWHYEVISTDGISKCEPFCLSMPLTDFYIDRCDMKVCGSIFDNPELLEVE